MMEFIRVCLKSHRKFCSPVVPAKELLDSLRRPIMALLSLLPRAFAFVSWQSETSVKKGNKTLPGEHTQVGMLALWRKLVSRNVEELWAQGASEGPLAWGSLDARIRAFKRPLPEPPETCIGC